MIIMLQHFHLKEKFINVNMLLRQQKIQNNLISNIIGLLWTEGVILCADKIIPSKLQIPTWDKRIYLI